MAETVTLPAWLFVVLLILAALAAFEKLLLPALRWLVTLPANQVIEELSTEWDPKAHTDQYRKRLKDVVDRKRKGHTVKAPEPAEEPPAAPDLMDALERTLAEMKGKAEKQEA